MLWPRHMGSAKKVRLLPREVPSHSKGWSQEKGKLRFPESQCVNVHSGVIPLKLGRWQTTQALCLVSPVATRASERCPATL